MNDRAKYFIDFYFLSNFAIQNYLPNDLNIQFKINNIIYKQPLYYVIDKCPFIHAKQISVYPLDEKKLVNHTVFDNQIKISGQLKFNINKTKRAIVGQYIIGDTLTLCSTPEPNVIVNLANKNYDIAIEKIMKFTNQNDRSLIKDIINSAKRAIL